MDFKQYYLQVLLEKDNRPKIIKMGIPQDVADYLHNLHDKYSLWFADKINKMPEYQNARQKLNFVHLLQTQMQGILDWIRNTPNILINNYTWEQALNAAQEYHDNLQVSELELEDNNILKKYDDGFYWVDLESTSDKCEANAMGHCATTGKGETLYSLRVYNKATKNIEPFITISVSPEKGQWHQCKGKKNSKPKKEYWKYIADILIQQNIFKYVSEYDSSNDFRPEEFISYLEENSDTIPNADEIIEKITENKIGHRDFEKILNKYNFKHYGIYLDDTDEIYANYSFYLKIKFEDTDLPINCLDFKNKEAKDYFSNIIDVSISDLDTEEDEEGILIYVNVEDEENSFNSDEIGLSSFDGQCRYYQDKDEAFDYDEFLKEHLIKILTLDGCIENPIGDFEDAIKENLSDVFSIKTNPKTLDLQVSSTDIKTNMGRPDFASSSIFRKGQYYDSFIIKSPSELKAEPGYGEIINGDLMCYSMFWTFIKNNMLQIATPAMRISYDTARRTYKFKFFYEWEDEQVDYEKEYKILEKINDEYKTIEKYFNLFEENVVKPYLDAKEELSMDKITVTPVNSHSYGYMQGIQIYYDDQYVATTSVKRNDENVVDKDALRTAIQQEIDRDGLTGNYKPLNTDAVKQWLIDHIPHQMTFKGFYETFHRR